jgi:hypothetical protein
MLFVIILEIPDDHYAYKLIDEMTHKDPQKRLGLEEVIKDLNLQRQQGQQ